VFRIQRRTNLEVYKMNDNQNLLQDFMQVTEALLGRCFAVAKAADPQAHARGCEWFDSPGSRFELRIVLGGRTPTPTHIIRGLIVDDGGEALWELFTVTTPSGNT
jgi:hypothetical protein